jgi:hypothetical protein
VPSEPSSQSSPDDFHPVAGEPEATRDSVVRLEDLPNVGPSIAGDLRGIGVLHPGDLPGRDPYALYDTLCATTGIRHDPCVLDVFISAVRFMEGAPAHKWWHYTPERKRTLATRAQSNP